MIMPPVRQKSLLHTQYCAQRVLSLGGGSTRQPFHPVRMPTGFALFGRQALALGASSARVLSVLFAG